MFSFKSQSLTSFLLFKVFMLYIYIEKRTKIIIIMSELLSFYVKSHLLIHCLYVLKY